MTQIEAILNVLHYPSSLSQFSCSLTLISDGYAMFLLNMSYYVNAGNAFPTCHIEEPISIELALTPLKGIFSIA